MNQRNYTGAIWTNHALERLDQRGLTQALAGQAFQNSDHFGPGKESGTIEFKKKFSQSTVTVITKKNDHGEWLILSCWIDPPLEGYIDYRKKQRYLEYQKAGFWKRLWMDIKRDLSY